MEDVKNKYCPFRVFREKTHFKYSEAEVTTEKFYDCLGEKCAAYYAGGCLRLIPPALWINGEGITDADMEKLRECMEKPSLVVFDDCVGCGNFMTEACKDCVKDSFNAHPTGWISKEVQG